MIKNNIKNLLILILLLILIVVIRIILNKNITEKFNNGIMEYTLEEAKRLSNNSTTNRNKINSLQSEADDPVESIDVLNKLYDSINLPTKNKILTKRNNEINDLFNEVNGKFKKNENKKCDYLDINPPIPCEDIGENGNKDYTDIDGITDVITNCKINCAKNCINDPKCISFEYDRQTKSCKLSSSCYSGNITNNKYKDLYFQKEAKIPSVAKFKRIPNKKCKESTIIKQNKNFSNKTLSECATACVNDENCISFEFKDNPGINNNICNLTNDCHKYTYIDNNNTDLFMKNNIFLKKTDKKKILTHQTDDIRKIPFKKKIQFFEKKNYGNGHHHYGWEFSSNSNGLSPSNLKYDRQNDDYDSVKIPPYTRIDMNQDYNHSGRHSGFATGKGGQDISNLDDHHIKRNKISSWKIRNTK